jgi:hypothetical protein
MSLLRFLKDYTQIHCQHEDHQEKGYKNIPKHAQQKNVKEPSLPPASQRFKAVSAWPPGNNWLQKTGKRGK